MTAKDKDPRKVALGKRNKRKGSRNELRTRRWFEHPDRGAYGMTKSGGSLGVWDLVGVNATETILVQVKSSRKPSPEERNAMRAFPVHEKARKLLVIWYDHRRVPEVSEV